MTRNNTEGQPAEPSKPYPFQAARNVDEDYTRFSEGMTEFTTLRMNGMIDKKMQTVFGVKDYSRVPQEERLAKIKDWKLTGDDGKPVLDAAGKPIDFYSFMGSDIYDGLKKEATHYMVASGELSKLGDIAMDSQLGLSKSAIIQNLVTSVPRDPLAASSTASGFTRQATQRIDQVNNQYATGEVTEHYRGQAIPDNKDIGQIVSAEQDKWLRDREAKRRKIFGLEDRL